MVSPRRTRARNTSIHPGQVDLPQARRSSDQVKEDLEKKQAMKEASRKTREKAMERVSEMEAKMEAERVQGKERRSRRRNTSPDDASETPQVARRAAKLDQGKPKRKHTESGEGDNSDTPTIRGPSNPPTRRSESVQDGTDQDHSSSELSEPPETPQPQKKRKTMQDSGGLRAQIEAKKRTKMPKGDTKAAKQSKVSGGNVGPKDRVQSMQVDDDSALISAWGNAMDSAPRQPAPPIRTQAVPPSPFVPKQEVKSRPKPRPKQKQKLTEDAPELVQTSGPAFVSDTEDVERDIAMSSPVKGSHARLTTQNLVEITDVDTYTPRPSKTKVKKEPLTPEVVIMGPTPKKANPVKSTHGKGKKKAHMPVDDNESSDDARVSPDEARSHWSNKRVGNGQLSVAGAAQPDLIKSTDDSSDSRQAIDGSLLKVPHRQKPTSTTSNASTLSAASDAPAVKGKWKIKDLPGGTWAQDQWARSFVPTLVKYQGTRSMPWLWDDEWSVAVVQKIWNAVFGDRLPHRVQRGDVVHSLATDQLYTWRKNIGQAGSRTVESYFGSNPKYNSIEERVSFAAAVREDDCFAYLNTLKRDEKVRATHPYATPMTCRAQGLFKSPFLLPVIAVHLGEIAGAVEVPALYETDEEENWPRGALGLATAAVERWFKLWQDGMLKFDSNGRTERIPQLNPQTGRTSHSMTNFSDSNTSSTTNLFAEVADTIEPSRRQLILDAARAHLGQRKGEQQQAPANTLDARRARLIDRPETR
ncbi:hypothetical protein OH77DRAFT_1429041 [Trametes cingulata]|nr:hypothetical protein OH77DRAFT_1429041 [Trametes cingulata]